MKNVEEINLIKVNEEPLEYAIKFQKFDISLDKIEDLINQRNNMKIILEKTYESMNILMKKFSENDNNLNSIPKTPTPKSKYNIDLSSHKSQFKIQEDNTKLKDILKKQIDHSENFRLNTEQILNSLREEFNFLVLEIENMKKTNKMKNPTEKQQILNNENKRSGTTNVFEFEINENDLNTVNIVNNNMASHTNTFNKKLNININNNINNNNILNNHKTSN